MIGWLKKQRRAFLFREIEWLTASIIELRVRLEFNYPPARVDKVRDRIIRKCVDFFLMNGAAFNRTGINDQIFITVGLVSSEDQGSRRIAARNRTTMKIYKWMCTNLQGVLAYRLEADHLKHSLAGKDEYARSEERDRSKRRARSVEGIYQASFGMQVPELKVGALSALRSILTTDLRKEQLNFYRAGRRFTPSGIQELGQILSVFSALLLVAGYLHTSFLYRSFRIDASKFFSIGDYLATSINQIASTGYSVFCFGVALAAQLLLRTYHRKKAKNTGIVGFQKLRLFNWFEIIPISAGLLILIVLYERGSALFWILLPVGVFMLFEGWLISLTSKYSRNPLPVQIRVILAFFFVAGVYMSAMLRIAEIREGNLEEAFFIQSVDRTFTDREHVFLGGNDRYIFLLQKDEGGKIIDSQIIPLAKVKEMNVVDSTPWWVRLASWVHRVWLSLLDLPGKIGAVYSP